MYAEDIVEEAFEIKRKESRERKNKRRLLIEKKRDKTTVLLVFQSDLVPRHLPYQLNSSLVYEVLDNDDSNA